MATTTRDKNKASGSRRANCRPLFENGDRVSTPSSTFYTTDDQRCIDFPLLYGTILSATDLSARVLWDIDQEQTSLGTDKLTKISKETPLQMVHNSEDDQNCDRSIFKKKKKGYTSRSTKGSRSTSGSKRMRSVSPEVPEVNLSSSDDELATNVARSPIVIGKLKKRPRLKTLKEVSRRNLSSGLSADGDQSSSITEDKSPEEEDQSASSGPPQKVKSSRVRKAIATPTAVLAAKKRTTKRVSRRGLSKNNKGVTIIPTEISESSSSDSDQDSDTNEESEDEEETATQEKNTQSTSSGSKKKLTPEEKKELRYESECEFGWKTGSRTIDVRGGAFAYGPKLNNFHTLNTKELDYFLHFFPLRYLREVILLETNKRAEILFPGWVPVSVGQFLVWLGIRFVQETIRLPFIDDYWKTEQDGVFPAMHMERYMSRERFFQINRALTLSQSPDDETQVLDFIIALNNAFQESLTPGHSLTVDESMISSRHRNLEGKKKIKRKPRPIGIEVKNLCDSKSRINLVLEKNESKEKMAHKDYHERLGATAACTLRLTKPYHGTGRVVYGDSWFGSVKTCIELLEVGLYSTLVIKTAHLNFPKECLSRQGQLTTGDYKSCINEKNGLVAVKYLDKKEKLLVSSCATTLKGKPREKYSRRLGAKVVIPRPKIFSDFCDNAGAIDIYNHYRTGGVALEDTWRTKSPKIRQFAGLVGFVETNAFLARRYFCSEDVARNALHKTFRKNLANQMLSNRMDQAENQLTLRPKLGSNLTVGHDLVKLPKRGNCYICSNAGNVRIINQTVWCCSLCGTGRPLCSPNTGRPCFMSHVENGFPQKKYRRSM